MQFAQGRVKQAVIVLSTRRGPYFGEDRSMAFRPTGHYGPGRPIARAKKQNKCAADSGCRRHGASDALHMLLSVQVCSTTTKQARMTGMMQWHQSTRRTSSQQPITHYSAVVGVKPRDPYGVRSAGVRNKGHGARVPKWNRSLSVRAALADGRRLRTCFPTRAASRLTLLAAESDTARAMPTLG